MSAKKHTAATRRKISASQQGKKNSMYGKRHSKAALLKIGLASRGASNPMFGKNHSDKTRRKISEILKKVWALKKKRNRG